MAAVATLRTNPVKQPIEAPVPAQLTLPSRDGKVTETFQKANASQFLSHIPIPPQKRITHQQMICAALRTTGALLVFGSTAAYILIFTLATINPLVIALTVTTYMFMLAIGAACLLVRPSPHVEGLDLEEPEVFKEVLDDLRTLSLKEICGKYTSCKQDKEFDYLCSKGVIDEATKEKMKGFKNRFEQLRSYYHIAKTAQAREGRLEIQSRTSGITTCAQTLERIVRDYQVLEAEFNRYRNAPQKA